MLIPTVSVEVSIPGKYAKWFHKHREWPVRVETTPTTGVVRGGQPYHLRAITPSRIVAFRSLGEEVLPVGEITPQSLVRPLSDAARHDLGAIRAALFNTTYPAPLAYEMANRDLVHPGPCFNKHHSVLIRRTHYSAPDEEARCVICKEAFE